MDIILGNALRKFLANGNYLEKYNSNVYTHTCVIIKDGKVNIQTNAGLDKNAIRIIRNFIYVSNYDNIILSVRTDKEPFSSNYPTSNMIRKLLNSRNNKNIVLFNQEPWPNEVPNFSDSNLVIRFGFDEGCKFDKLQLDSPLPLSEFGIDSKDTNYQNGTYHYLVNNQEH
jgi:hypothetical protein